MPVTLGSEQLNLVIPAGSTRFNFPMIFAPNTMMTMTFYIVNTSDIPGGSNSYLQVNISNSQSGQSSNIQLNAYNYGKYIQNYPIGNMWAINTYSIDITLYIQYTIIQYSPYYSPVIQDLTQLILTPNIITNSLTGGCNFRYYGPISGLIMANFPIGTAFYVLDQQVEGTSDVTAGSVQVPWANNYTENINVAAAGAAEDNNTYAFITDATSQQIPNNVLSSNAKMNWVKVDYYSSSGTKLV